MIYIVKVYEDGEVYEYEYSNEKHAREHMEWEKCHAELYVWLAGREYFMDSVN